jgi:hypothetical protein
MRSLSRYTGDDLLLGVFRTRGEADLARHTYLDEVLHRSSDPWANQAHHAASDDDVAIHFDITHDDVAVGAPLVYVVTSFAEGFGQVVVKFEAIVGTEAAALARVQSLNEQGEKDSFPSYCTIYEVDVGKLSASWPEVSSETTWSPAQQETAAAVAHLQDAARYLPRSSEVRAQIDALGEGPGSCSADAKKRGPELVLELEREGLQFTLRGGFWKSISRAAKYFGIGGREEFHDTKFRESLRLLGSVRYDGDREE